jgi:hypothetical protein
MIVEQSSTVRETRAILRKAPLTSADAMLKKAFFKNALFEVIARKN